MNETPFQAKMWHWQYYLYKQLRNQMQSLLPQYESIEKNMSTSHFSALSSNCTLPIHPILAFRLETEWEGEFHYFKKTYIVMPRKIFVSPLQLSEDQYRESYKFDLNTIRRGSKVVQVFLLSWVLQLGCTSFVVSSDLNRITILII